MTDTTIESAAIATGFAPCDKPARYLQQLVKHWSHKMASSWDADSGIAAFPFSDTTTAVMTARSEPESGIAITLTTPEGENERMRGVIERHLDRFAFREAPLTYQWNEPEDPRP
jgi:hypothetical protein